MGRGGVDDHSKPIRSGREQDSFYKEDMPETDSKNKY